jgi:hypothetical protein
VATARQGGDARVAAELVAAAPGTLASTTEFQCRVLLPLHALRHDISRGMALYRAVERSDLDWPDAAGIAQFLIETLHYAEALAFLAPMLERFPARHHLVQPYLTAVLHSRGPAFFQAEKARLLKDFGGDGDLAIIRSLPRNHLSGPELRRLIDHVLIAEPDGPRRTRELVTILESNSVETAPYLRERLRTSKNADERVFGHLLLARLGDLQKLSRANLGGVSWQEFEREAEELWTSLRTEIDVFPVHEPSPLKRNFQLLERVAARASRAWLNTAECYFDAASFAHWFCERLRSGVPTSVIRLGDGEGNFLPYPPEECEFQRGDQSDIQRKSWWGSELLSQERCLALSRDFLEAIGRADALGLPPPARLLRNAEDNQRSSRGVRAILSLLEATPVSAKKDVVFTSCHIHTDLDNCDLYRQIFRQVDSVMTVSCHDLSATLAE